MAPALASLGGVFSYTALAFGLLFAAFACKYYIAILITLLWGKGSENGAVNKGNPIQGTYNHRLTNRILNYFRGRSSDLSGEDVSTGGEDDGVEEPFISIHLPFYNEKNVARRILEACINLDYSNYEVLVVDDSRDETVEILKEMSKRRARPTLKFIHRKDRRGFKGGALGEALKHVDPRAEYVVVFDADFIPPSDILRQFLWYFGAQDEYDCGNSKHRLASRVLSHFNNRREGVRNEDSEQGTEGSYEAGRIAAVQGYQLHILNKSENWLTRGVRAEFSGSYMVERTAEEFFGAMKMIAGSVFMVRADILRRLGWTTSITEDWDLTIRLYLSGYKVLYTPLVQAPGEIPTTVRRLVRQRMRWAEGHTFAVKKYFWRVLGSPMITLREKLEFLYFAPYYLQSFFLLLGSLLWLVAELLGYHPFCSETFGWFLVLSSFLALPLMGLTGLFFEQSVHEDFRGVLYFIALSYIITPFQAYAALRGLVEKGEGAWIRTLKTGTITDRILKVRLRKVFGWISPKKKETTLRGKERREAGE